MSEYEKTLEWWECLFAGFVVFQEKSAFPNTLKEACKLVEVGFEYVCAMNNAKIFRKRK